MPLSRAAGAFSPAIVVERTQQRDRQGGGRGGLLAGPLGSEVMIGNDGAEDTWDNDGVENSPDD